jgi:cytochrome c553
VDNELCHKESAEKLLAMARVSLFSKREGFSDQGGLFSYITPETRVPANRPLRKIRGLVRDVLCELNRSLGKLCAIKGRPQIASTKLPSALLPDPSRQPKRLASALWVSFYSAILKCEHAALAFRRAREGRLAVRLGFTVLLLISLALHSAAAQAQNIEDKAKICAACHGENGVPVQQSSPVPVIWGQQAGYLFIELRDFKSGARKDDLMSPIAQGLNQADLLPLAEYLAQKTWPNLQQPPAAGDVAAEAERANASVVCTSCHQVGFKGDSTQPRLEGQVRAYLEKTMRDFRTGARGNNPGMSDLMKAISEQDIAALATYLAGL